MSCIKLERLIQEIIESNDVKEIEWIVVQVGTILRKRYKRGLMDCLIQAIDEYKFTVERNLSFVEVDDKLTRVIEMYNAFLRPNPL